jgi:hypothetical protein
MATTEVLAHEISLLSAENPSAPSFDGVSPVLASHPCSDPLRVDRQFVSELSDGKRR